MKSGRLWKIACVWSLFAVFAAAQNIRTSLQGNPRPSPGSAGVTDPAVKPDKARAYYHYSLGHLYQERGSIFNRPDLLAQAIEEFKLALDFDPSSSYLSQELADLYATTGRWRNALQEAEDDVSRHPDDVSARKLLGRLYLRLLTPDRGQQAPEDLQERAVKQFEQILQRDPNDISSYLILAQLYRSAGENAKAESILKKAIALQPDSSQANTNLALLYVDIGDYRAAIDLLKKIADDKAEAQVWSTLAYAYEQTQDYKDASSAYNRALERDPDNLAYRRGLGQSLLLSRQYDLAREQFEALIEANPRDVESYLRLSQLYRIRRQFDRARQSLAKALELAPDNPDIQFNEVLLSESEGKVPEAIALIQKILDSIARPDSAAISPMDRNNRGIFLEKLGMLYRDQGDFSNAESTFRQMLSLGKDHAIRAELHLIETYQENRQYDKALDASERAGKQYPESRELILERASLLASTGKASAAIGLLKPLLKNTSEDREIWLATARVYQQEKQFDQAREAAARALELSEGDEERGYIHFLYGSMWERQKEFQRAEQEFRKGLEIDPDSAMTLNYLGYMWADQGVNLDESIHLIQRALELEPNSGAYMDSLGWAYFKQNRLDLAQQYLEKAAQRLGSDPTILDHLAESYYSAGRFRDAQAKWKAALAEWSRLPKNEVDQDEVAKVQKKLKEALVRMAQEDKQSRP
jgi:tetratricopeptide (TPR) repeat protein